jgi:hypothetical protein
MRLSKMRFTLWQLMVAVAIVAMLLTVLTVELSLWEYCIEQVRSSGEHWEEGIGMWMFYNVAIFAVAIMSVAACWLTVSAVTDESLSRVSTPGSDPATKRKR